MHRLFLFVMALIALFALLRDGAWIGNRVLDTADRLFGNPGERLASKMVETVRGTVTGTVVVAVVEGSFIGIAYFIAGVPNPLLFTLLTMAFAMLPFGAWACSPPLQFYSRSKMVARWPPLACSGRGLS